jgi:hypothetical protein
MPPDYMATRHALDRAQAHGLPPISITATPGGRPPNTDPPGEPAIGVIFDGTGLSTVPSGR